MSSGKPSFIQKHITIVFLLICSILVSGWWSVITRDFLPAKSSIFIFWGIGTLLLLFALVLIRLIQRIMQNYALTYLVLLLIIITALKLLYSSGLAHATAEMNFHPIFTLILMSVFFILPLIPFYFLFKHQKQNNR